MGIGFIEEYFDIMLDNFLIVKKLTFIHDQGMKKVQSEVQKSRLLLDWSSNYYGDILRRKEDMYFRTSV